MSQDKSLNRKEKRERRDLERQKSGKQRKHAQNDNPDPSQTATKVEKDFIPLDPGADKHEVVGNTDTASEKPASRKRKAQQDPEVVSDAPQPKPKKRRKDKPERSQSKGDGEQAAPAEATKTRFILFIGNLPYSATDATLRSHFRKIEPFTLRHRTDPKTKKSKGFAFLEFENYDRMKTCLKLYHHSMLDPASLVSADGEKAGNGGKNGDKGGRRINVELTAGGGGKAEGRKEKIKAKNVRLDEQRKRRAELERKENATKERKERKSTKRAAEATEKKKPERDEAGGEANAMDTEASNTAMARKLTASTSISVKMTDASCITEATRHAESSHTLTNIPPEIFEHIAELLNRDALQNFRLVSKEANEYSSRIFIKRYFTQRAFMVANEDSLTTLLAIARHETFGHTMKTVVLSFDEAVGELEEQEEDHIDLQLEDLENFMEQQRPFRDRSLALYLLTRSFASFVRSGNIIEVRITEEQEADMPVRQANTVREVSGSRKCVDDSKRYGRVVFQALVMGVLPIEKLSVRMQEYYWPICKFIQDAYFLSDARHVFQNLKRLMMRFEVEDDQEEKDVKNFVELVASAHNLESLCLQSCRFSRRSQYSSTPMNTSVFRYAEKLFLEIKFPALKTLDLEGFDFTYGELVYYVMCHEKLERVHFHGEWCKWARDRCIDTCHAEGEPCTDKEVSDGQQFGMNVELTKLREKTGVKYLVVPCCTLRESAGYLPQSPY